MFAQPGEECGEHGVRLFDRGEVRRSSDSYGGSASTRKVCASLDKIFDADVAQFGTAMGKMIAYKEAKQTAEAEQARKSASKELKEVGAKVRKETATAEDPNLKQAGAVSATKFSRSASDKALFDKVRTTKDLDRTLKTKMPDWMDPVAGLCAT